MKRVLTSLILAFALSGMMALQATDFSSNDSLAALGYVMLNPLDTSSLPVIPIKDCGGTIRFIKRLKSILPKKWIKI